MSLEGKTSDQIENLAALTDFVMGNPTTARQFKRLLKQANPNLSMPEVELEDQIEAAVKPVQEQNYKLEARLLQRDAQDHALALVETLRDDRVVRNRADFGELVKYASENGYQTDEKGLRRAASARESENRVAEPTPMQHGAVDLSQRDRHKELLANPQGWARNEAAKALDDIIKGRKHTA